MARRRTARATYVSRRVGQWVAFMATPPRRAAGLSGPRSLLNAAVRTCAGAAKPRERQATHIDLIAGKNVEAASGEVKQSRSLPSASKPGTISPVALRAQ